MMKRTSGVLAALLASTLFLSGCAGTGITDVFGGVKAEATPTATTEPAAPVYVVGDLVAEGTELP